VLLRVQRTHCGCANLSIMATASSESESTTLLVQDILRCSRDLINPKPVIYFFDVTASFAQSISEDLVSNDPTIQYSNPLRCW